MIVAKMLGIALLASMMGEIPAEFSLTGEVKGDAGEKILEMAYTNSGASAQCILMGDFSEHPLRHALRIKDERGSNVPYAGPLAKAQSERPFSAFYIVAPGKTIRSEFRLDGNYELDTGHSYEVHYSLPITKCEALNRGLEEVPSAYWAFMVDPAFSLENWPGRLKTVASSFDEWRKVGFFAELEPVKFDVRSGE